MSDTDLLNWKNESTSYTRNAKEFWATRAADLVVPSTIEDLFKDYWTKRYLRQLKHLKSGDKMLDIGCGEAKYFVKLGDKFKEFYGIDLSNIPLKSARKIFPTGNHILADEGHIPFRDDSFAGIISWGAFEHNDYIDLTFKECYRIMAPNGVLLFSVPNYFSPAFPFLYTARTLKGESRMASIGHHYSNKFLRFELEKAGFRQIEFVDSIYASPIPVVGLGGTFIMKIAKSIWSKNQKGTSEMEDRNIPTEENISALKNFGLNLQYNYNKMFYPLERLGFGLMRVIVCHK